MECVREASGDQRIPEGTTVPATYTHSEAVAFIERQWGRNTNEGGLSLAITDAATDVALGLIVLQLHPQQGVAGLGYWIVPSRRGEGWAPRAVDLVTGWGLTTGALARIEAWVEPSNAASQRVLAKAGYEYEGTLRSFLAFETRRADAMVFSRVA